MATPSTRWPGRKRRKWCHARPDYISGWRTHFGCGLISVLIITSVHAAPGIGPQPLVLELDVTSLAQPENLDEAALARVRERYWTAFFNVKTELDGVRTLPSPLVGAVPDASSPDAPGVGAVAPASWRALIESLYMGPMCVSTNELDALFASTDNHRPAEAWRWYAHGLVASCVVDANVDGTASIGFAGFIWPTVDLKRESFVVIWRNVDDSEVMSATLVHELSHVLNAHHCEMEADGTWGRKDFKIEDYTWRHLVNHRFESPDYVRPGPTGRAWGEALASHETMHTDLGCPSVPDDTAPMGIWTEAHAEMGESQDSSAAPQVARQGMARLEIRPEKSRYFPGEPMRADVVLSPLAGVRVEFRGPLSIDPQLSFLEIWLRTDGEAPRRHRPILHGDLPRSKLEPVVLSAPVRASGLHFGDEAAGQVRGDRTLSVSARYLGLVEAGPVIADPVSVEIGGPTGSPLYDEAAHLLFADPEARRFVRLMGGDHLLRGRRNLEAVARQFPDTIYAPYANLALGVSRARPFQSYSKERDAIVVRPPRPDEAKAYLDLALARVEDLPRSHRILLHRTRILVDVLLALDAIESDPQRAVALYGEAKESSQAIARSAGSPPSPSEEAAREWADKAVEALGEAMRRNGKGKDRSSKADRG